MAGKNRISSFKDNDNDHPYQRKNWMFLQDDAQEEKNYFDKGQNDANECKPSL